MLRLIISLNGATVHDVVVQEGATTIGRREHCDVVLADRSVSGEHAVLHWNDGQARIVDCGSTNGVWVNEERIREPRDLDAADSLRMGHYSLRLVVEAPAAEAPVASAAAEDPPRAPAAPKGARLQVLSGPNSGRTLSLAGRAIELGRRGSCVVSIQPMGAHHRLVLLEGLGSVSVNDVVLGSQAVELRHRDRIRVGSHALRYLAAEDPA